MIEIILILICAYLAGCLLNITIILIMNGDTLRINDINETMDYIGIFVPGFMNVFLLMVLVAKIYWFLEKFTIITFEIVE